MSSAHARLVTEIIQRIGRTTARATQMSHAAAAVIGVNNADLECLRILQYGPQTAGELARRSGVTTASMTAMIDRLEKSGYVTRTKDPHDRRRVIVELRTDNIGHLIGVFLPLLSRWQDILTSYDEHDLQIISGFLDQIETSLTTEAERLRDGG